MTGSEKLGKGKTQLFAVEKHNVEDFVLEKYKEGFTNTAISSALVSEKKIEISPKGIKRWLEAQRNADKTEKAVKNYEKYEAMVTDYKSEITTILDEVKGMKDICIEKGDIKTYDRMIGRLYQGLELLAKLMGDIKPSGAVDINIIINEVNKQVFDENKNYRNKIFDSNNVIDIEAEIEEVKNE